MKRLTAIVCAVLAISLAICFSTLWTLNSLLERAHAMATDISVAMENGDYTGAGDGLVALAEFWDDYVQLFEVITDHDDLREVKERIIQAQISLRYEDMEDFFTYAALIGEGIQHIMEEEAPTWSNLC